MQTIFFWLSKLGWIFISPLNLIFIFLIIIWIFLLFNAHRRARLFLTCLVIILSFIALFPIGNFMLAPLEKRFKTHPYLPEKVEGIIILGGSMRPVLSNYWKQVETNGAIERELTFIRLATQYPEAKLVYTGGSADLVHQEEKEADVAKILFRDLGFDTSRIIFERDARNTYENVEFSLLKVKPEMKLPWILITSAYHMPRAVGVFCKQGWTVLPYPVDHYSRPDNQLDIGFNLLGHLNDLDLAFHEWIGLFIYHITGKTSDLFPGQCE